MEALKEIFFFKIGNTVEKLKNLFLIYLSHQIFFKQNKQPTQQII